MFAPLKTETIQALLDEARYLDTKPPEAHNMSHWRCDTVSCAVGDMMAVGACGLGVGRSCSTSGFYPTFGEFVQHTAVSAALGISLREAYFLFNNENGFHAGNRSFRGSRKYEIPRQTAARIRKFLYYRLHKMEILADYERARHQEGNWNVCQHAARAASLVSA